MISILQKKRRIIVLMNKRYRKTAIVCMAVFLEKRAIFCDILESDLIRERFSCMVQIDKIDRRRRKI